MSSKKITFVIKIIDNLNDEDYLYFAHAEENTPLERAIAKRSMQKELGKEHKIKELDLEERFELEIVNILEGHAKVLV